MTATTPEEIAELVSELDKHPCAAHLEHRAARALEQLSAQLRAPMPSEVATLLASLALKPMPRGWGLLEAERAEAARLLEAQQREIERMKAELVEVTRAEVCAFCAVHPSKCPVHGQSTAKAP
jgi:hypothetical protein